MKLSIWSGLAVVAAVVGLAGCQQKAPGRGRRRAAGRRRQRRRQLDDLRAHLRRAALLSPLTEVNTGNVGQLGLAWHAHFDTDRGQEATPLVVDGMLYTTTAWSKVYAFDAATGAPLWAFDPKVPGEDGFKACCDVVNRGVAVWKGKVYVGTIDGQLIALDAATGKPVWTVQATDPDQALHHHRRAAGGEGQGADRRRRRRVRRARLPLGLRRRDRQARLALLHDAQSEQAARRRSLGRRAGQPRRPAPGAAAC